MLAHISLISRKYPLFNCLGIQPTFYKDGVIDKSFLGFVYRIVHTFNKGGTMKTMFKYRIGEENDIILKNKFHVKDYERRVLNTLYENSFTLKHNASLDSLMEDDKKLKETLYYYMKRIELYVSLGCGNFLITSRNELYNKTLFYASEISNFTTYLVSEDLMPKNILLIGHKNNNTFGNPYVASPLIDENHFDEICKLNNICLDDFTFNKKEKYPLIDKYVNLYSLYQSYLDNVDVPYWYIETFNNPTIPRQQAYYTTLFFD